MKTTQLMFLVAIVLLPSRLVHAQAQLVPEGDVGGVTDKDIVGWNPNLSLNANISFVSNSHVAGQVEGLSLLVGLGLTGGVEYINGPTVWRNQLTIGESFAKTPVIDRFVKNSDAVSIESLYNYFLASKLGVFARLNIATSMFHARASTADPQTYVIASAEEGGAPRTVTTDYLRVASAFEPFTLSESVGGFAEPLSRDALTVQVRAGLGGRQTFAEDVLVQNDDPLTPGIELQELTNVHQAGLEGFVGLTGKQPEHRLTYEAGVAVLFPFLNNDIYDRSAGELMRFAIEAKATVGVFDWMSVVYQGSLTVDPQLFPEGQELTQFQNMLFLTFQYTLIDRKKGLKELEKEAAARREAEEKAAAEQRALEAEQRVKELEQKLQEQTQPTTPPPAPEPTPAPEPLPAPEQPPQPDQPAPDQPSQPDQPDPI